MPKPYEYLRHPRLDELRAIRPVKTADLRNVNHANWLIRLNARIGLQVTIIVGTMWTAYLFTVLALFALPDAILRWSAALAVDRMSGPTGNPLKHAQRSGRRDLTEVARVGCPAVNVIRGLSTVAGIGEHVVDHQAAIRYHPSRPALEVLPRGLFAVAAVDEQ